MPIEPRQLNGTAALIAAQSTPLRKQFGEYDTEFVKRIVCAYVNALDEADDLARKITGAMAR